MKILTAIIAVMLLTGCTSKKEKAEALDAIVEKCGGIVTVKLDIGTWGANLTAQCTGTASQMGFLEE